MIIKLGTVSPDGAIIDAQFYRSQQVAIAMMWSEEELRRALEQFEKYGVDGLVLYSPIRATRQREAMYAWLTAGWNEYLQSIPVSDNPRLYGAPGGTLVLPEGVR